MISTLAVAEDLSARLVAATQGPGPSPTNSKPGRTKYVCLCKVNLWGKLNLKIICGSCGAEFVDVLNKEPAHPIS